MSCVRIFQQCFLHNGINLILSYGHDWSHSVPTGPCQHILSFVCVGHLARTSVTPFDARLFQKTWQGLFPLLTSPRMSVWEQHLLIYFYGWFVLLHSTPHWRREMAPTLCAGGRGGAHIKIAFRGDFYEDKIVTRVVAVCRFSLAAWRSISCIEMWWNMFHLVDVILNTKLASECALQLSTTNISDVLEIIQGTITALFNDTVYKSDFVECRDNTCGWEFRRAKNNSKS